MLFETAHKKSTNAILVWCEENGIISSHHQPRLSHYRWLKSCWFNWSCTASKGPIFYCKHEEANFSFPPKFPRYVQNRCFIAMQTMATWGAGSVLHYIIYALFIRQAVQRLTKNGTYAALSRLNYHVWATRSWSTSCIGFTCQTGPWTNKFSLRPSDQVWFLGWYMNW